MKDELNRVANSVTFQVQSLAEKGMGQVVSSNNYY